MGFGYGEDADEVEMASLMHEETPHGRGRHKVKAQPRNRKMDIGLSFCKLAVTIIFLVSVTIFAALTLYQEPEFVPWLYTSSPKEEGSLTYKCPVEELSLTNYDNEEEYEDYLDPKTHPLLNVGDDFLETYRNSSFDGWSRTFNQFKESMEHVKEKFYVPYVKSGDRIYESACGLGLNSYLTLEVLQEKGGISNLTLYANEYIEENVERSRQFLELLLEAQDVEVKNQIGSICHGDSTNLTFVPANSFDLVFTGYLSPLWDPLKFGLDFDSNFARMKMICHSAKKKDEADWRDVKLAQMMQQIQDDWFAGWFEQMVRIAKPGAPVIVEEVAKPLCKEKHDWGGVTKSFWRDGVAKYGWDVDVTTLQFASRAKKYDNDRYHVFFRKNQA